MRGPDVHVNGYGPGPATDQWSCDCGQNFQKILSLLLFQSFQPTPSKCQLGYPDNKKRRRMVEHGVGW